MATEKDWSMDGGRFIAANNDGYRLAHDVNVVFATDDPREYMDHYFPWAPPDIVDIPRYRIDIKGYLQEALIVGSIAIGSVIAVIDFVTTFTQSNGFN